MTLESLGPEEKQILFGNTVPPQGPTNMNSRGKKNEKSQLGPPQSMLVAATQARLGD